MKKTLKNIERYPILLAKDEEAAALISTHSLPLLAKDQPAEAPLPEWYLLFPEGISTYASGDKVLTDKESYRLVQAMFTKRGVDIVFDYEHQSRADVQAPASGWIKGLRWDGGIWAQVEWTAKAAKYIRAKEYRYYSPGLLHQKIKGKPYSHLVGIDHAALTNLPLTYNLKPLVAKDGQQEQKNVSLLDQLIAIRALGLAEGATEEEVVRAVEVLVAKIAAAAAEKEGAEPIDAKVAVALGLPEDGKPEVIFAKIKALQTTAETGESVAEKVKILEAKLETQAADQLIAKHGDRITPAMIGEMGNGGQFSWLYTLAKSDEPGFEAVVASLPVQIPRGKLPGKTDNTSITGDDHALTGDQLIIAKSFGIKPADFAKELKEGTE